MESFSKYKDSVFNAIDKEMNAFHHAVREEMIQREHHFAAEKKAFQEEIHTLRQGSSRIEELENENKILKSKLNLDPAAGGVELSEAQDRLEDLKTAYGQLVGAHRLLKEKYKLAQETNRKWDHYYQNVSQRPKNEELAASIMKPQHISNANNGQQTTSNVLATPSPRSSSNASVSVSPSKVLQDARAISQRRDSVSGTPLPVKTSSWREAVGVQDVFDIPPGPGSDNIVETCDESQNESISEHSLTDQQDDTVDQTVKQPAKPIDDSSDYPVIVAERSLKRKRDSSFKRKNREVHDEHTHYSSKKKPIRIKSELDSSSPIAPVPFPGVLDPQDSIDLDEVGEKHFTPRKRRRLLDERQLRVAGLRTPVVAGFDEVPVADGANDKKSKSVQDQNPDSEKDEESDQRFDGDIGSEEEGESDQPFACDKAFFMQQGQEYGARLWEELQRNKAGQFKSAESIPPKVLKTADPNIQLSSRSSRPLIDRKRTLSSNRRDRASAHISILTEDGDEYGTLDGRKSSQALNAVAKAKQASTNGNLRKALRSTGLHQRLGTLLAKPSSQRASLASGSTATEPKKSTKEFSTPANSSVLRNDGKVLVTPISKRGQKAAGGTKASEPTRPSLRSRTEAKPVSSMLTRIHEPREVLPEYKSLRTQPVATLRPTDFKLNPARNQGYNYAFSEVVRNRDLRKCMPGCKKPGCCGTKIRKAVEIGGYTAPRKCGLLNSSPEENVAEDELLLEEYLGGNKSRLKGMPAGERQEILLQAKTEQFANVHGKHRYVYGRAQSPPGYWDPDMPDTPREMEYRAAAMAKEMERTAEMYKEAMRPDGLYRFRDE